MTALGRCAARLQISGFVLIRAIGFHHVDALIGLDAAGVRLNWAVELGGIGLFASGALLSRPVSPGPGR